MEVRVWGFRNGGARLWMSLAGSVVESLASKTLTSTEKTPKPSWLRSHLCRRSQLEVSRLVPETLDRASLNNLGYGRGMQGGLFQAGACAALSPEPLTPQNLEPLIAEALKTHPALRLKRPKLLKLPEPHRPSGNP